MWDLALEAIYLFAGIGMMWLLVWLYATDEPVGSSLTWPRRPSTYCPGLPRMGSPEHQSYAGELTPR